MRVGSDHVRLAWLGFKLGILVALSLLLAVAQAVFWWSLTRVILSGIWRPAVVVERPPLCVVFPVPAKTAVA